MSPKTRRLIAGSDAPCLARRGIVAVSATDPQQLSGASGGRCSHCFWEFFECWGDAGPSRALTPSS